MTTNERLLSERDLPALNLPAAQWQQYAEASAFGGFAAPDCYRETHEMDEKGEAHSFWDEFLHIFNIRRRQFARHKARAKRSDNRRGFIDLFWPGKLLVEHKAGHKNAGATLAVALEQAMEYIGELEAKDRPQQLIICNFKTFQLYDVPSTSGLQPAAIQDGQKPSTSGLQPAANHGGLKPSTSEFQPAVPYGGLKPAGTIPITELPQRIREFAFLLVFAGQMLEEEEKASIQAIQGVLILWKTLQAGGAPLADLYDPLKMPAELLAAHQRLDLAADACYGIKKGFQSEAGRVGWLFGRWGALNSKKY